MQCRKYRLRCCLVVLLGAAALWGQSKDSEVRIRLEQAEKAQQQGDLEGAAREYRKAVELDPTHAQAHAHLGMIYNRLGRLGESTEAFERALRLDPALPRVNVLLAFNYIAAGRRPEAIPLLSASFETESQPSIRLVVGQRLVECHLATGNEEQALAVVQKLRQVSPDDPDVTYAAMKVYMALWNGAFQRLLGKTPPSYRLHQVLAESLEAQEKYAEAASQYRKILQLAPQLPGMHYQLGRMILRGDPASDADQKALAEFQKEMEMSGAVVPALVEIGEIHLRRKELEKASHSFSRAVQIEPGNAPARVGLAKVLMAEKQWAGALEHLEAAEKLAPEAEAVAYNLMLTYRGLGRLADAKRALDTFQRLKEQSQRSRSSPLNPVAGAPPPGRNP